MIVQTTITPAMYAELATSDYVVARTYRYSDGRREAKVIAVGSLEDMRAIADTPKLMIVRYPIAEVGDSVVAVSELLPPDEKGST